MSSFFLARKCSRFEHRLPLQVTYSDPGTWLVRDTFQIDNYWCAHETCPPGQWALSGRTSSSRASLERVIAVPGPPSALVASLDTSEYTCLVFRWFFWCGFHSPWQAIISWFWLKVYSSHVYIAKEGDAKATSTGCSRLKKQPTEL